jgi:hypothetical protein
MPIGIAARTPVVVVALGDGSSVLKPFIKRQSIVYMESEPRTFSCQKCGRLFVAQPPYEGYETALDKPCPIKDHDAPQLYECENCGQRNVLYWCSGKRPRNARA